MILEIIFSGIEFLISYVSTIKIIISKIVFSDIKFSDISFYINSMNIAIIIMRSLIKLNFYDFTFLITKDVLIKIIKKALFCLYS